VTQSMDLNMFLFAEFVTLLWVLFSIVSS
jgi:hypothetical protein